MPRHTQSLAPVLLLLAAAGWLLLGGGGCNPTPGALVNVAWDSNGNGLPDRVTVGDYDHDGVREMDDIQDAIDALSDPGPKLVTVQAGDYVAPVAPELRAGRTHAILELDSNTTFECAGVGATILHAAPLGSTGDYAVLANRDHANGNDAIAIRHCEIDGAAPASYSTGRKLAKSQRMGVYFRRTRNSEVSDSYVHDTVHTGLYTSNSSGDQFLRNVVEDAGAYGGTVTSWRQPCIYLYAFGGGASVSDFRAADNTLRRCGHSGLNTRAEHTDAPGDAIRNLIWERNTVEQTLSHCVSLRGVDGALVRFLTCHLTAGIGLARGYASGYRSAGDDNANSNVTIEDAVVSDVWNGQAGLDVGAFVDGLTLRRVRIDGTRSASGQPLYLDCAWLQRPLRGALLEDVELRGCGKEGMVVSSLTLVAAADETLTLRRLTVADVDQVGPIDSILNAGVHFSGAQQGLLLEDLELSAATGPELRFDGAVSDVTLRRITIDSVDPGWLGAFAEASAPVCTPALEGKWLTTLDGSSGTDCAFSAGTGVTPARCGCLAGAYGPTLFSASPGIELATGVSHASVALEDVTVANARAATGVRVGGALTAFTVDTLLGLDDSAATDLPQRSAIDFEGATGWSVSGVSCVGTQPGVPCVE